MNKFMLADLSTAMSGSIIHGDPKTMVSGFATDSRTIKPGDCFIAIVGERTDGHLYLEQAHKAGAAAAIVQTPNRNINLPQIEVDDAIKALGRTALWHRNKFDLKVVGVTGSVGKTSVKEMTAVVLSSTYHVLKNEANLNTDIGLPLTLLNLDVSHHSAVLEMGMRGFNQIAWLAEIAKPQIGVIVNIGDAHIELLGSRQNIAKAKSELLNALPESGIAVLPRDDEFYPFLKTQANCKTLTFGYSPNSDVRVLNAAVAPDGYTDCILSIHGRQYPARLPVAGRVFALNAAAAVCTGLALGVQPQTAVSALGKLIMPGLRMQTITSDFNTILLDAYNANPQSVAAGLETLFEMNMKHRNQTIVVLGDMKELGDKSEASHREVGALIAKLKPDELITFGELAEIIAESAIECGYPSEKAVKTHTHENAVSTIKSKMKLNCLIFIKGSRAMEMERIAEGLFNIQIREHGAEL